MSRRRWALRGAVLGAAALGVTGCLETAAPTCGVSGIALNPTTVTVQVGETREIAAAYTALNCSPPPAITWTSSNPAVATVATDGKVTGVAVGGPVQVQAKVLQQFANVTVTVVPATGEPAPAP